MRRVYLKAKEAEKEMGNLHIQWRRLSKISQKILLEVPIANQRIS